MIKKSQAHREILQRSSQLAGVHVVIIVYDIGIQRNWPNSKTKLSGMIDWPWETKYELRRQRELNQLLRIRLLSWAQRKPRKKTRDARKNRWSESTSVRNACSQISNVTVTQLFSSINWIAQARRVNTSPMVALTILAALIRPQQQNHFTTKRRDSPCIS